MARNIDEIINEMDAEATKYQELSEFRDNSKMSFFRYLKLIVAMLIKNIELMFEKHKAEVEQLIENQEIGQIAWWEDMIYKFQYGDSIDVVNNIPTYFNIHEEKRIIRHVVVSISPTGEITIKAYKENSGVLYEYELAAVNAYVSKIKPVGTIVEVISTAPDRVKYDMDIELESEIFDTNGVRISDSSTIIRDTINEYLGKVPGGILYNSHLIENLKAIDGIKDVWIKTSQVFKDGQFVSFNRKLTSDSGCVVLDENSIVNYVFD